MKMEVYWFDILLGVANLYLDSASSFCVGSLLNDSLFDTTSLGKRDFGLLSRSNHKDVLQTRCKGMSLGILDCDNIKGVFVMFNVHHSTYSSSVAALGEHNHGSNFEFDNVGRLSSRENDLDNIVDLDIRIGKSDGTSIVGDGSRNLLGTDVYLGDTTELVGGLFSVDAVHDKSSLGIEQHPESISTLFEFNDIHETSGEVVVRTNFVIDLDVTFHANLHTFLVGEGILEAFAQHNGYRDTFTHLVWTSTGLGSPDAAHLGQIPMVRRIQAFQVLLRSARPVVKERNSK
jgi:hypothetical protein